MRSVLFYIAGATTVGIFFTLWCAVAVQRVRKESEASKYGELCARIQEQIDETRMRISSVKMQLHIADHALDQALLQWKYEYLMKQEQWLIELMCGKRRRKAGGKAMKCSISTYYKILDAELYDFDDGYMQLNVDIDAKSIDIEGYASKQKKSVAEMCNVPEENVIPISRLEYEAYMDE